MDKGVKEALKVKNVNLKIKRDTTERFELRRSRTPQGVFANTTLAIEPSHGMAAGTWCAKDISRKMIEEKEAGWAPHHEYILIVKENFDELWNKAVEKNKSEKHPVQKKEAPSTERRTVSVTLDKVLRKEFSDENKAAIKQLLIDKQARMSSHIDEIQSAIAMAQLEVSKRNDFVVVRRFERVGFDRTFSHMTCRYFKDGFTRREALPTNSISATFSQRPTKSVMSTFGKVLLSKSLWCRTFSNRK